MTTLIVPLPVGLATRLARAADQLGCTHAQFATVALRMMLQAGRQAGRERPAPVNGAGDGWDSGGHGQAIADGSEPAIEAAIRRGQA